MSPLVSVIVTCFNQETTLAQTLESILSQECTFKFEIILGDDFSTDLSRQIGLTFKERYPSIIHLIYQEKNVGVAKNWIPCIQAANGVYVAACAADDYWHYSKKLQTQIQFFEDNSDYGFLYTDYDTLNVNTSVLTKTYLKSINYKPFEGKNLTKHFFSGSIPILPATAVFKKYLFDQYIPKDDFSTFFPIEDWPTWVILSKYCKIAYLPISTATYRQGHESLSNISDYEKTEKRFIAEHTMYKYLCELFPEDIVYNSMHYETYIDLILLSLSYKREDFGKANFFAKKLFKKNIYNKKILFALHSLLFNLFNSMKSVLSSYSVL